MQTGVGTCISAKPYFENYIFNPYPLHHFFFSSFLPPHNSLITIFKLPGWQVEPPSIFDHIIQKHQNNQQHNPKQARAAKLRTAELQTAICTCERKTRPNLPAVKFDQALRLRLSPNSL